METVLEVDDVSPDGGSLAERMHALLDEFTPAEAGGVTGAELAALAQARARLDAMTSRRLASFDASCTWAVDGAQSGVGWLTAHTRCSSYEAHRQVHATRQLRSLDTTRHAWESGAINTEHVEVIVKTRKAAKADHAFAEFEPTLIEVAQAGLPEDVTAVCQQWRDALDADRNRDGAPGNGPLPPPPAGDDEHERRGFNLSTTLDGMGLGDFRAEALDTEIILTAIRLEYERAHVEGDPRTPTQQRLDAFVSILRRSLDHNTTGNTRRTNLPHVLVITDVQTLDGDAVGECRLGSGVRVSPDTARRLCCDALVYELLVDQAGIPLALGHAKRAFTNDQFRVLVARDGRCRGPGCRARADRCQAHHLDEWERDNGRTDIDNGALFCWRCHRMLHEGGWQARGDPNDTLEFYDRHGRHLGSSRPAERARPILTRQGRQHAKERQHILQRLKALTPAA